MNTYDFDETISIEDSEYNFYKYCLRKYPRAVLRTVPRTLCRALSCLFGRADTASLKAQLFSYLRYIPDVDVAVADFWEHYYWMIQDWYLAQKRDDDIIISASPEFLLKPVANRLGVRLIATIMNKNTGEISGPNCHDHEKVRRFYAEYPDAHTEQFYSDSLSDSPMAEIADEAFLVKKGKLSPWPKAKKR